MGEKLHGKVVVVTGASSGIGLSTALLLAKNGYRVYGGSRRGELPEGVTPPIDGEGGGFLCTFPLDIADDDSIRDFVNHVLWREGRVDILVNAAGMGLAGAIEDCTSEDVIRQFKVNFIGALHMQNAFLPAMRKRNRGMIIHIGSVGGRFPLPFQGLYASSKAALASATDVLRLELLPYNVKAALIEPGDVKTGFTLAREITKKALRAESPYRVFMDKAIKRMERDENEGMPPEAVANAVLWTLNQTDPPPRNIVGKGYRFFAFIKRMLPARTIEKLVYKMYCK